MPLLDKVKAQASQAAQKAQAAGRAGQARLEDAQARRKLDGLYRSLGAAVYAGHKGEGGDRSAEIERLYAEIEAFEAAHGESEPSDGGAHAEGDDATPD